MSQWGHIVNRTELEQAVTHRSRSLFADDMEAHRNLLHKALKNARVLVIGAAGSIGSATAILLADYPLKRLSLVDISENNLVELVRDLRSRPGNLLPDEFEALPVFLGSSEFAEYMSERDNFDYILNFAALKHVRSEKNAYCLKRMLRTNVVELEGFLKRLPDKAQTVFSVSSDKSVNPGNLMGASKALMEQVLWRHSTRFKTCTARFANVAFSDGSLLYGIVQRLSKHQPITAPSDVRRFFISHREAAELSLLAAVSGQSREIYVPAAELHLKEQSFSSVATEVLRKAGYEPVLCKSEREARELASSLPRQNKWPCYFSPSDTSGEKPFEEFVNASETRDNSRFEAIEVLKARFTEADAASVSITLDELATLLKSKVSKSDIVSFMETQIPSLHHIETHKSLDEKM